LGVQIAGIVSVGVQLAKSGGNYERVSIKQVLIATATGAISGALAATSVGLVGQIIGNAALGVTSNAIDQNTRL
jgi:uncharacterized membrane protein